MHSDAAGRQGHSDAAGRQGHSDAAGRQGHSDAAGRQGHSDAAGRQGHSDAAGLQDAATAVADPALAFHDVRFAYVRTPVLRGLTFDVPRGQVVGLLGPNGCGKTTALRLISGGLRPDGGAVEVEGRPRSAYGRRALARRVALVPQELELTFDFLVEELVLMGRSPHVHWLRGETARDAQRARQALVSAGVGHLRGRSLRSLSGGEKQRVILAMALAQEPQILLLDEPTHNLDIANQVAMFDLLVRLSHNDGLTALAAIHDINLASLYCDHLILMRAGRVMAAGPPAAVITVSYLEQCYGAEVAVFPHPGTGRPQVALLPRTTGTARPGGRIVEPGPGA